MSPLLSPLSYGPVGTIMPAGNPEAEPRVNLSRRV